MEAKSGKRTRRGFVKVAARSRAGSGMVTARQLGLFVPQRNVALRSARGMSSSSVFQATRRQPELKFLDVGTSFSPSTGGAGSLALLNGCAQGTDAIQHIGRQTTMKSLYWLWEGAIQGTTTGSGPVRLIILYDKEAEGAAPTIATGAQTDAFSQDSINAQQNLNNRDRFIVLVDEIVECVGTAGPQAFMRKGYRKISLPCVFNASSAATVAAINTGSVYAFCWSGGNFGVAPVATNLQTRIRFEDA